MASNMNGEMKASLRAQHHQCGKPNHESALYQKEIISGAIAEGLLHCTYNLKAPQKTI
jgi:hypothetical protein